MVTIACFKLRMQNYKPQDWSILEVFISFHNDRRLGLKRIHQVTNTIRIANIGWRIRICIREYTFFSEAINFFSQCSKFHNVIMLSNFINLIKTIIEMNEFTNFLSTSVLKNYFLNINI